MIEWRTIVREPAYEVSACGKVRIKKTGKLKSQFKGGKGLYMKIWIDGRYMVGDEPRGKQRTYFVHRLVAEAFLPPREPHQNEINHKDANKLNNHYTNLEWCTGAENLQHARVRGLLSRNRKTGPSA